jgi:hypothetical protein
LAESRETHPLLGSELVVLNVGLDIFRQALEAQKVRCAQVDLMQAPKLEKKLADALDRLL